MTLAASAGGGTEAERIWGGVTTAAVESRPVIDASGNVLSVPMPSSRADEICPGLWLGGLSRGAGQSGDPNRYDLVVSCLSCQEPAGTPRHLRLAMLDGPHLPDPARLGEVVAAVVAEVRAGGRVLVRCYAGVNRSGLVAVLSLAELWSCDPATALQAARALRSPWVLCNPAFERYALAWSTTPAPPEPEPRPVPEPAPDPVVVGTGWRAWRVGLHGRLRSPFFPSGTWYEQTYTPYTESGPWVRARCEVPWLVATTGAVDDREDRSPHVPPGRSCWCGISVAPDLAALDDYFADRRRVAARPSLVVARVEYGGGVLDVPPGLGDPPGTVRVEYTRICSRLTYLLMLVPGRASPPDNGA